MYVCIYIQYMYIYTILIIHTKFRNANIGYVAASLRFNVMSFTKPAWLISLDGWRNVLDAWWRLFNTHVLMLLLLMMMMMGMMMVMMMMINKYIYMVNNISQWLSYSGSWWLALVFPSLVDCGNWGIIGNHQSCILFPKLQDAKLKTRTLQYHVSNTL